MLRFFISICISFSLMTTVVTAEEMTQQEREEIAAKLIPVITMLLFSDETEGPVIKDVISGDTVILNSSDIIEYNATSTYSWALSSSNPEGIIIIINDENSSKANFISPIVSSVTTLEFILTVTDSDGTMNTYSLTINVEPDTRSLVINEISSAYYTDEDRWFEIYNKSNLSKNLSDFTLRSRYYDGTNFGIATFVLPSKIIPPKGYLVIRPDYGPAYNITLPVVDNTQVLSLKDLDSKKYPIWYTDTNGFLEILQDGKTVDFITIGADYTPTTVTAWSGDYIPTFTIDGTTFYQTLARNIKSNDTNSKTDWVVRNYATYAGVNDVTCNEDIDADGIPDCSEVNGSTYAGIDLYAFGARTNQKDIFIEVDYMDSTDGGNLPVDEGIIPRQEALDKVAESFLINGYTVHFDVGDLFAQDGDIINPAKMDLGGGNEVAYSSAVNLGCTDAGIDAREYKVNNMQVERKSIFYYMLFGTSQNNDGSNGSSGCAENPGNDSLITLGSWGLNSDSISNTNTLINFQSGTIMHEFGHNLGLSHGGNENENYKPNYLSVMNYLYQLDGLATIGDNEGDRYYLNKGGDCPSDALTNPYYGEPRNFKLDYSHGIGTLLDEVNGIDESKGLGRIDSVPVDYDCNGVSDETLTNFNVNVNWDAAMNTVTDHDDWSALNIIFARTYSGNAGISIDSTNKISINPLNNDIQPIAEEPPIKVPTHK